VRSQAITRRSVIGPCGNSSPPGERLTVEAAGLYLDYSKNRISEETLRLLVALAASAGVRPRIEAMFRGDLINVSEQRAVLHVALRAPASERIVVDGDDVVREVHAVLCSSSRWRATASG
jgi:glucose-6-phosphate isomerase